MDIERLSDKMKNEAVSLGLCAEWTAEWKDGTDKDEMAEKFVRGIDFCISHDWPSVRDIKKYFGDVMHSHGVYADENVSAQNPSVLILNGCCVADVSYDTFGAGQIYARHETSARITVRGMSKVFVDVHDNASVTIDCDEYSRCFVFRYGGNVRATGNVTVKDRTSFRF